MAASRAKDLGRSSPAPRPSIDPKVPRDEQFAAIKSSSEHTAVGSRSEDLAVGVAEIPTFLLALCQTAAEFARLTEDRLQHVLVTEYAPGAAIGWHRDRPEFEDVIGISLATPCLFRFRRKQGTRWERASIELQPRSAYLLRGSARWDWQYSIPPVDKLRYSITFRSLRESKE